jgi:triosephosphate isomerase
MKRIPIVAGNWKMHKTIAEARALVDGLKPGVAGLTGVEVVVCPPYTALAAVREAIEGSAIALGAQDVFWKEKGAYTSQVAPSMLVDAGCRYVIIGHSENRGRFGVPEPEMTEAYEPVWAIGTGETCDTPEANRVCGMIRSVVERVFGADAAQAVRIQYGGSVKPGNAKELFSQEHIDGGLVGGAALEAESFTQIVRAALS